MDAVINLYKPEGMTSFRCVAAVRRILNTKKVGHAGTLDPEASGVLPICVGKATKLLELFLTCPKKYKGEVTFGISTDTQDIWGEMLSNGDASGIKETDVTEIAKTFIGCREQLPPMYSAVKIGGIPLYKLARRGAEQPQEVKPRKVNFYDVSFYGLTDLTVSEKFGCPCRKAAFEAVCSRGTYMRTLCFDMGTELGVPACMSALNRTAYGPLLSEKAVTLEELEQAAALYIQKENFDIEINGKRAFYPAEYLLKNYLRIDLNDTQYKRYRLGQQTFVYENQLADTGKDLLFPQAETDTAALYYRDKLIAVAHFCMGTDLEQETDSDRSDEEDTKLFLKPWKFMEGVQ